MYIITFLSTGCVQDTPECDVNVVLVGGQGRAGPSLHRALSRIILGGPHDICATQIDLVYDLHINRLLRCHSVVEGIRSSSVSHRTLRLWG